MALLLPYYEFVTAVRRAAIRDKNEKITVGDITAVVEHYGGRIIITVYQDANYASSVVVAKTDDEKSMAQWIDTLLTIPEVKSIDRRGIESDGKKKLLRMKRKEEHHMGIANIPVLWASDGKKEYSFYDDGEGNIRQSEGKVQRSQSVFVSKDSKSIDYHLNKKVVRMFLRSESPEVNCLIKREKIQAPLATVLGKDVTGAAMQYMF